MSSFYRCALLLSLLCALWACSPQPVTEAPAQSVIVARISPTPTVTPTPSPSATPTITPTPTPSPTPTPTLEPGPAWQEIGRTVQDQAIRAVRLGNGPQAAILIGGLHAGFAPASVDLAERLIAYFTDHLADIPPALAVYIIPSVNLDSRSAPGQLAGRLNANGVDLNRNWDCRWAQDALFRGEIVPRSGGPAPFSEPETTALAAFIQEHQPLGVIFWQARYVGGFISPGRCGSRSTVSFSLSTTYGQAAGYRVDDFEIDTGQVTNGDAANWLDQQGIPAAAVLLPDYDDTDWEHNLPAVLAVLQFLADQTR